LLIGLGGLGSSAGYYLAAAGVGRIGIVDDDVVEMSNLQRQILHATPALGRSKVESGVAALVALNPSVTVVPHAARFDESLAGEILGDYDFVVDATDNFESKFLIADECHRAAKPYSHAGINRFLGQTMTVLPGHTCYRCVFDAPPPGSADRLLTYDALYSTFRVIRVGRNTYCPLCGGQTGESPANKES
jgi:molybdopterin/thiamine biosynthesis adenylyltransferase